jgi:SRSO17 transposase
VRPKNGQNRAQAPILDDRRTLSAGFLLSTPAVAKNVLRRVAKKGGFRSATKYRCLVNDDMGEENGVLIIDESGFKKKGDDSAGVYKQYCGNIGKADNCQVGVFAAYASSQGYALYIPEPWFSDTYREKRDKCGIPPDLAFKTKPQLAVDMVKDIIEQGILPVKYITADSVYGSNPDFIEAVARHTGKVYFLAVPGETRCWLRRPVTMEKECRYRGETRKKRNAEALLNDAS